MRTRIYVDGFNLYFGALRKTPHKWLDLAAMARSHLDSRNAIIGIKYFTAKISPRPGDNGQTSRQEIYFRALRTIPNLEIFFGHFLSSIISMPFAAPAPDGPRFARMVKTEEKGSDVNIASQLLKDAYGRTMDCAVIVSGDSDLLMPLQIVKNELGIPVGVLNPQERPCRVLKAHATFYKHLRRGKLARSQFPSVLTDATGRFTRPQSW